MKSSRRTVSSRRAFMLTVLAACLGFGGGFGAHSFAGPDPSASGSSPAAEAPEPSPMADSELLDGDNVLAAADLDTALSEPVALDSLMQSEGQEALLCQRRALGAVASLDGLVKASYVPSDGALLADEVVVTVGPTPQTTTLVRTLIRWNDVCDAASLRVDLGVPGAVAWSFSGIGRVPWYAIVVRDGDRVGWLLLSPFKNPADPTALAQVAQTMLDRLGS